MKLGLNSMVFCDSYNDDCLPWVANAAQLGYSLLEVVVGESEFDYRALRQDLCKYKVGCVLSGGMTFQANLASEDVSVRAAGQAYLSRCCKLASELGSPTLSGPFFINCSLPQPRSHALRQKEWDRVAEELYKAATTAQSFGVTLCIEPLNRYKTDLINTVEQASAMIAQVGASNLKILYDTYHANIEEANISGSILAAGSLLGEVHLCDNHKGAPGSGHISFDEILFALKSVKYCGAIIFESFLPYGKDNIWQPLESDPYILAQQAIQAMNLMLENQIAKK